MRAWLSVAVLASLCLATPLALARDCAYFGGNGPSVYGLQNGLTEGYAHAADQAGLGGLRLDFRIDTQTTWDQALFDQYDAYLAVAREHGYEVTGILGSEITTQGQADWNAGFDATGYSPYVAAFVSTASMLMSRYGGQIKSWEIWNEPNAWTNASYQSDPTHAGGTYILPLVYSKLLAEVYVEAKSTIEADGLSLVAGGLFAHDIGGSFSPATDYMGQVYQLGPWDWMQANEGRRYPWDAFGYHLYIDQGGATTRKHLDEYLNAVGQLRGAQRDASPVWITEFGWQSPSSVSDAQQADNLAIALDTFASRAEIGRTFVFKVDDYDDWGLFDASWNAKPSAAVLRHHAVGCTKRSLATPDGGAEAGADASEGADGSAGSAADAGGGSGADAQAGAAPGVEPGAGPDSDRSKGGPAGGCALVAPGPGATWLALVPLLAVLRRRKPLGLKG